MLQHTQVVICEKGKESTAKLLVCSRSWPQLSCQDDGPNEERWAQCVLIDPIEGSLMKAIM